MISGPALQALVRRPDLWPAALATGRSLVPRGWWRHKPFLPLPDQGWLQFRLETAYGGAGDDPIGTDDLIAYLEWKRDFPR